MKLRAYIVALHAALFAIFLALSYAHAGPLTLLGAGKPAAGGGGGGTVVFDATSGAHTPANGTTVTWNHTLGAGASAVAICIGGFDGTGAATLTAATFGGVNILPGLVRASDTTLVGDVVYILGLTNLVAQGLTGTQTVSLTWSGSMSNMSGTSMSVTGSNNTTLFSNTASTGTFGQNTTSPTLTVGSAVGELVFDFLFLAGSGSATITGPQVAVAANMANGSISGSASRSAGASPNVTPTYTTTTAPWIMVAASFKN